MKKMRSTYVRGEATPLVQWRAVFGGVVLGLATMLLLTALWLAIGMGSGVAGVMANLDWYLGGSAIFAMLLGGYLAGWLGGVRGASVGLVSGLTVWGLVMLAGLLVAAPAVLGVLGVRQATSVEGAAQATVAARATWPVFWSLLIGFGAAAIGGLLGGITPRVAAHSMEIVHEEHDEEHDADHHEHDRDEDRDRDRPTERRRTRVAS